MVSLQLETVNAPQRVTDPNVVSFIGWWTKDGEKISKSLGNVIDPIELVEKVSEKFVCNFLTNLLEFL